MMVPPAVQDTHADLPRSLLLRASADLRTMDLGFAKARVEEVLTRIRSTLGYRYQLAAERFRPKSSTFAADVDGPTYMRVLIDHQLAQIVYGQEDLNEEAAFDLCTRFLLLHLSLRRQREDEEARREKTWTADPNLMVESMRAAKWFADTFKVSRGDFHIEHPTQRPKAMARDAGSLRMLLDECAPSRVRPAFFGGDPLDNTSGDFLIVFGKHTHQNDEVALDPRGMVGYNDDGQQEHPAKLFKWMANAKPPLREKMPVDDVLALVDAGAQLFEKVRKGRKKR